MPTPINHREAKSLPLYQSLLPTIQEKVCLIEALSDRAIIYLRAREGAPTGVPDFDSYLRDVYKNVANVQLKGFEDGTPKEGTKGTTFQGLNYEDWAEILGDSRYRPHFGNLSHVAVMLSVLWIYWMTWPNSRKVFEGEKKLNLRNLLEQEAPPSAPSFEAALDRSLVWLALALGEEMANTEHWGKKKEGAVRSNLSQRTKTSNKVTDAFHQIPKKQGDTLNHIVILIYKYLIKTGQTKLNKRGEISPGQKTIERVIKTNKPLMTHYFNPEERGKSKRLIYNG
jgi:hypothetical protein